MHLFPVQSVERSVEQFCGFVWGALAKGDRGPPAPSNFSNFIFRAISPLCFISSRSSLNACQPRNEQMCAAECCLVMSKYQPDVWDSFHGVDHSPRDRRPRLFSLPSLLSVLSLAIVRIGTASLEYSTSHTESSNASSGQLPSARKFVQIVLYAWFSSHSPLISPSSSHLCVSRPSLSVRSLCSRSSYSGTYSLHAGFLGFQTSGLMACLPSTMEHAKVMTAYQSSYGMHQTRSHNGFHQQHA